MAANETRSDDGAPHPYIPHTDEDRRVMLARLGLDSTAQLFEEIPERFRDPAIELPTALAEWELVELLRARAAENAAAAARPSFLGAGAYRRAVPAVVASLVQRGEFMTAYTPYQPEISQGTLQAIFEWQTMIAGLTGLDVANATMYDGSSATAEAALMAMRVTRRERVVLSGALHPHYAEVVRCYASQQSPPERGHLIQGLDVLERAQVRERFYGARIGVRAAEPFWHDGPLALSAIEVLLGS